MVAGQLRVAVFPQPAHFENPYLPLLHEALSRRGVAVLPPERFGPGSARRAARDVDLVHLHWIEPLLRTYPRRPKDFLPSRVKGALVLSALAELRRAGVPVVWTVHNLRPHEPRFPRLERRVTRAVLATARGLIVHSEYGAQRVREELQPEQPVFVVPHGHYIGAYEAGPVTASDVRARHGIPAGAFVYLVFGKLRAYKRVPELVDAFRALERDDAHLLIAGAPAPPAYRRVLELAAAGHPRVHLDLRSVPDAEVPAYHAAADAAVLNYRDVFSSGALLLALSFGLPVVAPDPSTAAELARPPAIESFRRGDLADALARVREGDQSERRASALAAARASSWERAAEAAIAAYRAVLR